MKANLLPTIINTMLYHRGYSVYSNALVILDQISRGKSELVADALIAYDEAINIQQGDSQHQHQPLFKRLFYIVDESMTMRTYKSLENIIDVLKIVSNILCSDEYNI